MNVKYKLKDNVDFETVNKKSIIKYDFDLSNYYDRSTRLFTFPNGYAAWHLMAEVFKDFLEPSNLIKKEEVMIENNQYYESKIKTSRIDNKYHKTKWEKSWTIDNDEIITTTPTTETKDLRCKFVSAKDYLKLYRQLEEKEKIINEMLEYSFRGCCPYEIFVDEEQDECEKVKILCNCKKCKNNFKECWLKYFKNRVKERGKDE